MADPLSDPLNVGGGGEGTGEEGLDFEPPLAASDAAARLGMSTDAAAAGTGGFFADATPVEHGSNISGSNMSASTPAVGNATYSGSSGIADSSAQQQQGQGQGQGQPPNRQGSLFERIQAAQIAQGMSTTAGSIAATGTSTQQPMSEAPPFASQQPASTSASLGQSHDFGGGGGGGGGAVILEEDDGPMLYASGPSVPQYNPGPSGDPYATAGAGGLPQGASAGERVAAVAGAAWDAAWRLGSRAARTGYRTVSGGEGGQAGLLGGGGGGAPPPPGMDVEGGGGSGSAGGAPYAPPGSQPGAGTTTMEGIGVGGGGPQGESYSMLAYARQFLADVCGLIASAPAPVQYALILCVCYIFWKIFA